MKLFFSLTFFWVALANADYVSTRAQFKSAKIPTTYDLDQVSLNCRSFPANSQSLTHEGLLFRFQIVPHNHRIIYSYSPLLPGWAPSWFSEYMGLRTSVPVKYNDFISMCPQDWFSCMTQESPTNPIANPISVAAYLRMNSARQVFVEWTVLDHDAAKETPISSDDERPDQKAIMYSVCERAG